MMYTSQITPAQQQQALQHVQSLRTTPNPSTVQAARAFLTTLEKEYFPLGLHTYPSFYLHGHQILALSVIVGFKLMRYFALDRNDPNAVIKMFELHRNLPVYLALGYSVIHSTLDYLAKIKYNPQHMLADATGLLSSLLAIGLITVLEGFTALKIHPIAALVLIFAIALAVTSQSYQALHSQHEQQFSSRALNQFQSKTSTILGSPLFFRINPSRPPNLEPFFEHGLDINKLNTEQLIKTITAVFGLGNSSQTATATPSLMASH